MIACVEVSTTDAIPEPVTLDEAKVWLKVDGDETADDLLIQSLITTARKRVEERHHRAFIRRSFDAYLDPAPSCGEVRLPRSPLASITSVKGFTSTDLTDTGGTAMSSSGYYADTAAEPGRLVLTGSVAWPTATRPANPIIVRFVAGESTSRSGVQDRAKTEILQTVALLYEHRGDEAEMAKALEDSDACPSDLSLPEWG